MLHPECPVLRWGWLCYQHWGQTMQNGLQSPESVILGVDTHLDVHVGVVISQVNCLVPALFRPLKLAIWNCLSGLNLLGFLSELALKEPELMVLR